MSDLAVPATKFFAPIAEQIWAKKYRLKTLDGTPIDATIQDTLWRIAHALAAAEKVGNRDYWAHRFADAMAEFKFIPAGRIIAGAGSDRNVTLFNCYVMGTIPDAMKGIFNALTEAALTMQQGGGIGYDFSPLRPKNSPVKGVAADASGPLSFMDVWDAMCRTILSAGTRRGAMMATMRCDHPDIEAFIEAKADPNRLRMFNLSVLVTDDFMEAVENDVEWQLVHASPPAVDKGESPTGWMTKGGVVYLYKTVKARDLWEKIMASTYAQAEPGVIFIDRINAANNLKYCEKISATNPCGEQPLPPYGACLLGSINLPMLIKNAFTDRAQMDSTALRLLVATAVRMMDNVIDVSKFPLEAQQKEAFNKRRIGLGITGLADALIMCGLTYGTDEAARVAANWMRRIDKAAYLASSALAKEKGSFPLFDVDGILAPGTHASTMDTEVQNAIRRHGLRNALLTSIAPTGTISLYAGNVSSGCEPIFAYKYTRKIINDDGTKREEQVEDLAYREYRRFWETNLQDDLGEPEEWSDDLLPPYFVSAQTLTPEAHVKMQAALQKHVDSSISKTVNCPEDISFEDFKEVYMLAYRSGCKGITTYRPNEVTGSILSVKEEPKAEALIVESNPPAKGDWAHAMAPPAEGMEPPCTCHPDDNPPVPCPHKYALTDCRAAAVLVGGGNPEERLEVGANPVWDEATMKAFAELSEAQPTLEPSDKPRWDTHKPAPRGERLEGATYHLKAGAMDHAFYFTINHTVGPDGSLIPFELFANSKNMEAFPWVVGLTRMISAVFRKGGDVSFVIEELKAVFDPKGGFWDKGTYYPSVIAAMAHMIEDHLKLIGYIPPEVKVDTFEEAMALSATLKSGIVNEAVAVKGFKPAYSPAKPIPGMPRIVTAKTATEMLAPQTCPKCFSTNVSRESGCLTCKDCGESKCG